MHYVTISTLTDETFLITPLEEGQALHFGGNRHTAPAGEPIRVYGTGPVELSQGKWGNRLRVAGEYNGPYFDGSTSPDPDLTAEWMGAVDASESRLMGRVPTNTTYQGGTGPTIQSTAWTASGTYSCRVIPITSSMITWAAPGGDISSTGVYRLGMQPGHTYTIAVWCRLERPLTGSLGSLSRRVVVLREGWNTIATSDPAPNEAGAHLLRLTFTVPESATTAAVRLYAGSAAGGGDVWWDDFTIVEGVHPDLMPFHGGYQSTTSIDSITVQRRIADGEWVTLAEDVQPDGAVTDPIPALAGTNTYRAVSKTTLPTSANGPNIDYQINETKWHYINTGPNMSEVYKAYGNPNLSRQHTRNRATIHMAGRANPITITGENRSSTYTLTAQLTPDATPPNQWENLEWTPDPICYRDPSGQRILGTVNGLELTGSKWPEVSVGFTKTDYQEEEIYE